MKAKTNKSSNPYRRVIHPSIRLSCMVPRQKSCIAQISFVIHIKIDQYHSLRSVPRATSPSHESKNKQIIQPLSKIYPSIYMTELHGTKTEKFYTSNIICDTHQKIDQYPSLRSAPRATSKSHESKNKQILQPLSKSCPSIYMT